MKGVATAFSTAALLAILFTGCMASGPRALLDGERLINEARYELAAERLKLATQLLPQNAQAWNHLGLAYHGAGQWTKALQAYHRALTLDKNLAAVRYNLGCGLLEQKDPVAAIDQLKSYTLIQPSSADGWLKLAAAQLRARQLDAAERSYQQALKLGTRSPEALNGLGVIQLHRRRTREAIQFFNAALSQEANYPPALLNLAVVSHQYLNNRPFALQKYRQYLVLKPRAGNWQAVEQVAQQLELELRPASPLTTNNSAIQTATSTNLFLLRTNSAMSDKVVAVSPAPPATQMNRSFPPAFTPVRKPESATNVATRVSTPTSDDRAVPPFEVVHLPEEPVVKPARDAVPIPGGSLETITATPVGAAPENLSNPIIDTSPKKEKPSFIRRMNPATWFRAKPKSTAAPTPIVPSSLRASDDSGPLEAAPSSNPTPLPGRLDIARYKYRSPAKPSPGNRREAEQLFAQGVEDQKRRRLAAAVESYQAATRVDPAYFDAQYNLGLAAYEGGNLPLSLSAYETGLAINPAHSGTRYNFALALRDANYLRDAAEELEKVLTVSPDDTRAHLSLANLYAEQLIQPRLARVHYLKVIEKEPNHPQATAIRYWLSTNP
ncbi:MAG: tetratricopeptide repeat protein [Verrucomicrobiota bacterium]